MPLTNTACKNAKPEEKTRKLADGGGLYLEITPAGGKYWRMKYRIYGKEKRLAIGVYPDVSLEKARIKRQEAKKLLSEHKDPSELKKQEKLIAQVAHDNSFEMITKEWHESKRAIWTTAYGDNLLKRMEQNLFPDIGARPIADITAPELLAVIKKVESRGAVDIAKRLLQISGQIFRYAVATGRTDRDPSGDLRGALKSVKTKHHAYLKEQDLPEYLQKLAAYEGHPLTCYALQLLLLTFVRSGELRGAKWEEIDIDKAEWRIPAERMKMREIHIVPLSRQALEILEHIRPFTAHGQYIFPNQHHSYAPTVRLESKANRGCMSENTLLYALYRMGYHSRATAHGFRATASTILNEHGFRVDVIERQLAHSERNGVRAAYNHGEYLPERREMMQWWGDYIEGMKPNQIQSEIV